MRSERDVGITPVQEREGRLGRKSFRLKCSLRKFWQGQKGVLEPESPLRVLCLTEMGLSIPAILVIDCDQLQEVALA